MVRGETHGSGTMEDTPSRDCEDMPDLTLRPKTTDDDAWIVASRNRLADHLPPSTVERFRHWEQVDLKANHSYSERYVAEREGQRVGTTYLEKMWWSKRTGGFVAVVAVAKEFWGQGIGAWMYDRLAERLTKLGAERAYANVRNDRPLAQQFAKKRGFEKTGHADRWSRLNVQTADMTGYTGTEERLKGEGIVIQTLAETGESEEFLRKLHLAQDEAVSDIPSSEAFAGSPFELFVEEIHSPGADPERIWVALEGEEPVGIAVLELQSGSGFNGFTGVRRSVRGRGVARALKCKTLDWSKAHDIEYIYTANDVNNRRMLAINNSLGYQELPISEEVMKPLVS
jgi:GNAT superfamily N-acetyltransferase